MILGAGPAGAGAAFGAARRGHRVMLIERADAPGGAAGSFEVGGVRVDHGSHRLHPSIHPEILADLRTLLGDELQRRTRRGRIRLAGRWIGFPLKAADLATRLPFSFAVGGILDAVTGWARRPRADTFADVLYAGLGKTMCERFYFPYARKLWGLDPQEISAEQARRRVAADSPLKLARKLLRGKSSPDFFYYPRRGFGAISEALADAAEKEGARVLYGAAADRVRFGTDGVRVILGGGESVEGARLWSTVPIPVLARMTEPAPPDAVIDAAARLEYRSMCLVYLVLDCDRYTEYDAHYLPEESTPVTRVSEPKNYRDGNEPRGRTVLCAEIPCGHKDDLWNASDERLANVAIAALTEAGLPPPSVQEIFVKRLSHAYPVYRIGFERNFDILDEWATTEPRLLTLGRQGLFVHDNSHHALAMAWAAVDALRSDGAFDEAAWAAARARFAEHVVED